MYYAFKVLDSVLIERIGLELANTVVVIDDRIIVTKLDDGKFNIQGYVAKFANEIVYNAECCTSDGIGRLPGLMHRKILEGQEIYITVTQQELSDNPFTLFVQKIRQQYTNTQDL
jgi:hypothetical protein